MKKNKKKNTQLKKTFKQTKKNEPKMKGHKEVSDDFADAIEQSSDQLETFYLHDALSKSPHYPKEIYGNLPQLLKRILEPIKSRREQDMLLMSSLVGLGSVFKGISCKYRGKKIFANLYYYPIAPAASGKGVILYAKYFLDAIHEELKKNSIEVKLSEEVKGDDKIKRNDKKRTKTLFIPGNSSSAAVVSHLVTNDGLGIIIEPEADTIAIALNQDWGGYTDLMRCAFEHEPYSSSRKQDFEFNEIKTPRLSMIISSTPNQLRGIIKSTEDGLYSRFVFYPFNTNPEWIPYENQDFDAKEYYTELAPVVKQYAEFINSFEPTFKLTKTQSDRFNEFFAAKLQDYQKLFQGDVSSMIYRMGCVFHRIAMILTALRFCDQPLNDTALNPTNEDCNMALMIVNTAFQHNAIVFEYLSHLQHSGKESESHLGVNRLLTFIPYEKELRREDLIRIAGKIGISKYSVDKYLKRLVKKRTIAKVSFGVYKRIKSKK